MTVRRGRAVLDVGQDGDGAWIRHQQCTGARHAGDGRPGGGRHHGDGFGPSMSSLPTAGAPSAPNSESPCPARAFRNVGWLSTSMPGTARMRLRRTLPYFDFVCDQRSRTVSCPQPDGRHRFEFMHDDDDPAQLRPPSRPIAASASCQSGRRDHRPATGLHVQRAGGRPVGAGGSFGRGCGRHDTAVHRPRKV